MILTATLVLILTIGVFIGFCFYIVWRERVLQKEHYFSAITQPYTHRFLAFQKVLLKKVLSLGTYGAKKMKQVGKTLFFFFFPSAKKAFEKKHLLTGLHHGPTSYFLDVVSTKKQEKENKSRTRKKI